MSLIHDVKYLNLISNQIPKLRRKSDWLWDCRCFACGDSQKNTRKRRGYFIRNKRKDGLTFYCHNCNACMSLGKVVETFSQQLYEEYCIERYASGETGRKSHKDIAPILKVIEKPEIDLGLPSIADLAEDHYATEYLTNRQIPKEFMSMFFFAEDFMSFAMKVTKGEYKQKYHSETTDPRIVIPFYDRFGKLIAIQGRSLLPNGLRYVTIKFDESAMKIFGQERWNPNKITYITEGPFDSLFVPNGLAMAGSSVDVDAVLVNKLKAVFIFDNEPRNKDIVKQMLRMARKGYGVCVWADTNSCKDINDMILSGRTKEDILSEIEMGTHRGLSAELEISKWKRC